MRKMKKAVIWTSGTTHSINLVANGLLPSLHTDDEILISQADHHANFVTWHETAKKMRGKKFKCCLFWIIG